MTSEDIQGILGIVVLMLYIWKAPSGGKGCAGQFEEILLAILGAAGLK